MLSNKHVMHYSISLICHIDDPKERWINQSVSTKAKPDLGYWGRKVLWLFRNSKKPGISCTSVIHFYTTCNILVLFWPLARLSLCSEPVFETSFNLTRRNSLLLVFTFRVVDGKLPVNSSGLDWSKWKSCLSTASETVGVLE